VSAQPRRKRLSDDAQAFAARSTRCGSVGGGARREPPGFDPMAEVRTGAARVCVIRTRGVRMRTADDTRQDGATLEFSCKFMVKQETARSHYT
jgi:hypothetical protein